MGGTVGSRSLPPSRELAGRVSEASVGSHHTEKLTISLRKLQTTEDETERKSKGEESLRQLRIRWNRRLEMKGTTDDEMLSLGRSWGWTNLEADGRRSKEQRSSRKLTARLE